MLVKKSRGQILISQIKAWMMLYKFIEVTEICKNILSGWAAGVIKISYDDLQLNVKLKSKSHWGATYMKPSEFDALYNLA